MELEKSYKLLFEAQQNTLLYEGFVYNEKTIYKWNLIVNEDILCMKCADHIAEEDRYKTTYKLFSEDSDNTELLVWIAKKKLGWTPGMRGSPHF